MEQKPIPSDILKELHSQKWVIMFELAPLSDKFQQIMLTPQQAKDISVVLFASMAKSKTHPGMFVIPTNDQFEAALPNVPFSYSPEKVKEEVDKE